MTFLMTMTTRACRAAAISCALLLGVAFYPSSVSAQDQPSGIAGYPSVLIPSEELGGGTLLGGGLDLRLGVSARSSIIGGFRFYPGARHEEEPVPDRGYNLYDASVEKRTALLGSETNLGLILGGAAQIHSLGDFGASEARRDVIPAGILGASLETEVFGPLRLSFDYRHRFSYVHQGHFGFTDDRGERDIVGFPELRIGLSVLRSRDEPRVADIEDLPLTFQQEFRPVDASDVRDPYLEVTSGREHVHIDGATMVELVPREEGEGYELEGRDFDLAGRDYIAPSVRRTLGLSHATLGGQFPARSEHLYASLRFATGSETLEPSYREDLKPLADKLRSDEELLVRLEGFATEEEDPGVARSLSEQRATAVKRVLVRDMDVPQDQVDTKAVVDSEEDDEDKAEQAVDRVDVVIVDYGAEGAH